MKNDVKEREGRHTRRETKGREKKHDNNAKEREDRRTRIETKEEREKKHDNNAKEREDGLHE